MTINLDEMSEQEIAELAKNCIAMVSKITGKWYHITEVEDDRIIHMFQASPQLESVDDTREGYIDVRDIEDRYWTFLSQREVLAIALNKIGL